MLWYKHFNDFRNTAHAKAIQNALGDRGFAAAIRLLEVMCERCGSGEKFCPTLELAPPCTKLWLGQEILSPTSDDYGERPATLQETEDVLDMFDSCAFIERGEVQHVNGSRKNSETGKWETATVVFETITLGDFFLKSLETWTARQSKAKDKTKYE